MKKTVLLIILAVILLISAGCGKETEVVQTTAVNTGGVEPQGNVEMTDEEYYATFKPVLRFVAASDVHITDAISSNAKKFSKMLDMAYDISFTSDTGYDKLDAVCLSGDVVDHGRASEFDVLKTILDKGLQFDYTVPFITLGNHEYEFADGFNSLGYFMEKFDCAEDDHIVVNGFHFIRLCPTKTTGKAYSKEKQDWLKEQLEEASKDTPDKPIFVFDHHAALESVCGTINNIWGSNDLLSVLKNYPQVVNFTGHSHFTSCDPRSLYQDRYTTVHCGGMAYFSLSINGSNIKDVQPADEMGGIGSSRGGVAQMGEFLIVEVDESGAIRITGYSAVFECKLYTRYIREPADRKTFINNRTKKRVEPVPYFDVTSEVELLSSTAESVTLKFSQAKSEGYIESYRAIAYEGKKQVAVGYCLADNFFVPIPEELKIVITGLKKGTEYTVKIYAVNAYDVTCKEPLEITVKTK